MSQRCLGHNVSAFVAGELDPAGHLNAERHLVACQLCRAEVELERRVRDTLRAAPVMPAALLATLMSVSQEIPVQPAAHSIGRPGATPVGTRVPAVPMAPTVGLGAAAPAAWLVRPVPERATGPLRVLGPQAPAQHRSALRATAFATAAAGASIVALWAFSVGPGGTGTRSGPAAAVPGPGGPTLAKVDISTVSRTTTIMIRSGAPAASGEAESTP